MHKGSVEFRVKTYLTFVKEYYELFKEVNLCEHCEGRCCKEDRYYGGIEFKEWPDYAQLLHKLSAERYGEPKNNPEMCDCLTNNGCDRKEYKPLICITHLCHELNIILTRLGFNIKEKPLKKDLYNILNGIDFDNSVMRMEARILDIKSNLPRIKSQRSLIQEFIEHSMKTPSIKFPPPRHKLLNE